MTHAVPSEQCAVTGGSLAHAANWLRPVTQPESADPDGLVCRKVSHNVLGRWVKMDAASNGDNASVESFI